LRKLKKNQLNQFLGGMVVLGLVLDASQERPISALQRW